MPMSRRQILTLLTTAPFSAATLLSNSPARAFTPVSPHPVEITDITGRKVLVKAPVGRLIAGEGRQSYLLAALERENPFARVIGWRDDFRKADLDSYTLYEQKFPQIAKLPTFGGWKDGAFDVELVIALRPDVVVMNLESKVGDRRQRVDP